MWGVRGVCDSQSLWGLQKTLSACSSLDWPAAVKSPPDSHGPRGQGPVPQQPAARILQHGDSRESLLRHHVVQKVCDVAHHGEVDNSHRAPHGRGQQVLGLMTYAVNAWKDRGAC